MCVCVCVCVNVYDAHGVLLETISQSPQDLNAVTRYVHTTLFDPTSFEFDHDNKQASIISHTQREGTPLRCLSPGQ